MKPNNSFKLWLTALVVAAFLSACASTQEEVIDPETDSTMQDSDLQTGTVDDGTGADTSGIDDSSDADVIAIDEDAAPMTASEMLEQTEGALANRTIYFEFDSAKLSDESLAILEEHGNFIAANGEVEVRLEGHTDERGSREYNIALGDRRAQSVRRVLLFQGASTGQVDTVSYGEERPAVAESNEEAWARNRRVELIYKVN